MRQGLYYSMQFERNKYIFGVGEKAGFVAAYFLFTTILFYILYFLNKLPETGSYFNIIGITLLITLLGTLIKRGLK